MKIVTCSSSISRAAAFLVLTELFSCAGEVGMQGAAATSGLLPGSVRQSPAVKRNIPALDSNYKIVQAQTNPIHVEFAGRGTDSVNFTVAIYLNGKPVGGDAVALGSMPNNLTLDLNVGLNKLVILPPMSGPEGLGIYSLGIPGNEVAEGPFLFAGLRSGIATAFDIECRQKAGPHTDGYQASVLLTDGNANDWLLSPSPDMASLIKPSASGMGFATATPTPKATGLRPSQTPTPRSTPNIVGRSPSPTPVPSVGPTANCNLIKQLRARLLKDGNLLEKLQPNLELQRTKKEKTLAEIQLGQFCSICSRSKSEIEKTGEPFDLHLVRVEGHAVIASSEVLVRRQAEFDKALAAMELEIERYTTDREIATKKLAEEQGKTNASSCK